MSRWYGRNLQKGISRIADKIANAGKSLSVAEVLDRMGSDDLTDDPSIGHFIGQEVKLLCDDIDDTRQRATEAFLDHPSLLSEGKAATVFLVGGGSRLPCIQSALTDQLLERHPSFEIRPVPAPEAPVGGALTDHFHRLNVAYGLSFQEKEIQGTDSTRCRPNFKIFNGDVIGYWHYDEGPDYWR